MQYENKNQEFDFINQALNIQAHLEKLHTQRYNKALEIKEEIERELEEYSQAIKLCEKCLEEQVDLRRYAEEHQTALLQAVFGNSYNFHLDITYKADGVTVEGFQQLVEKNGQKDQPKAYGGGVQNVVSLGWRLIFASFIPNLHRVLILDEPWLNLNERKWIPLIHFLEDYQKEFNLQIIVITHVDAEFPQTYKVMFSGNTSIVEQMVQ